MSLPGNRLFRPIPLLLLASCLASSTRATAQEAGVYGHYEVYDTDNLPRSEYAGRRAAVIRNLDPASAMVVRSAEVANRSNDVDYPFRQRNNMLYLCGVNEPNAAIVLVRPSDESSMAAVRVVLFVGDRNPGTEKWTGLVMGPDVARSITGVADVRSITRLGRFLDSLLPSMRTLYYDGWAAPTVVEPLLDTTIALDRSLKYVLKARYGRLSLRNAGEILGDMRCVKSSAEIALMRKAIAASVAGHRATIRSARPGLTEYQLAATMEFEFARAGAESYGYPSIVGSGPNSCILHYETKRRRTEAGELVLMDCGAEYHGYSADVTRTFPVSGHFTAEQRTIYDLVLKAQNAGIAACRPGNAFIEPHRRAQQVLAEGLVDLGVIDDANQISRYFPHGTSHFLGMDVHDVGNFASQLQPGMIMTVEPGIYIPAGSPCDRKWWNIGIRIEDDILITDGGAENLSGDLERTADDIEALMKGGS